MKLTTEGLPNGVTKAVLVGRMDIDGAQAVDLQFNVLAGSKKRLVLDMSGVDFIASMGLRTLMTTARSITSKGGKMAIAAAPANVSKVLDTSGLASVITVAASVDAAVAAVSA